MQNDVYRVRSTSSRLLAMDFRFFAIVLGGRGMGCLGALFIIMYLCERRKRRKVSHGMNPMVEIRVTRF